MDSSSHSNPPSPPQSGTYSINGGRPDSENINLIHHNNTHPNTDTSLAHTNGHTNGAGRTNGAEHESEAGAEAESEMVVEEESPETKAMLECVKQIARTGTEDSVIAQSHAYIKENKQDYAVELMNCFLQQRITELNGDDMDTRLARIHAEYGYSLLQLYMKESTQSVLGGAMAAAEDNKESKSRQEHADTNSNNSNAQTASSQPVSSTSDDDLQAAWDSLEIARSLYGRLLESSVDGSEMGEDDELAVQRKKQLALEFARVYEHIGDVSMESENFMQSYEDYGGALKLYQQYLPPFHRDIAAMHSNMAVACLFDGSQVEQALTHYKQAAKTFQLRVIHFHNQAHVDSKIEPDIDNDTGLHAQYLQAVNRWKTHTGTEGQATKEEHDECVEILEELQERISSLTEEIASSAVNSKSLLEHVKESVHQVLPSSANSNQMFDFSAVSTNSPSVGNNNGFSASTTGNGVSNGKSESVEVVNMPTVKRKVPAVPAINGSHSDSSKKQKLNS